MKTITVNSKQVNIYNKDDFPYNNFSYIDTIRKSSRSKKQYVDLICSFDIETTSLSHDKYTQFDTDIGFMYVWQFACDMTVCMGRTWSEYVEFINKLTQTIKCEGRKLVVYVHNLSFEFQFMRDFFEVGRIFCRDKRNVVYAEMGEVEYRCSYILSNMGLDKFTKKSRGVTFVKQSGKDFDYSIERFPDTVLTDEELGYCVCDVLGLVQAIKSKLQDNHDTLATVPITSTGYVRRDFRDNMYDSIDMRSYMNKLRLNEHTYMLCMEASRGAISGSNHMYTEEILEDVDSEDIKSSYPFQMATKYFPMSKFIKYNAKYGTKKLDSLLSNYCCIIVWSCRNLRLKRYSSIPYISKAKCRAIQGFKCGNGKVYYADRIGMCCTEIDFQIIADHYTYNDCVIHEIWCAQRGMLPKPFRETLLNMFQIKTDLEDGDPYEYGKYKNKINAAFGMMLTDILHNEIIYRPNTIYPWEEVKIESIENALKDYYYAGSSFLHYQHGVWVLAHGRSDLSVGMDAVGDDIVQVDTDSVKHLDDHLDDFERINREIIAKAENYDVKPYSIKNGKKHYLGVWEHEGQVGKATYHKFITLGAKKYAEENEEKKISITVAGLSKNAGKWFEQNGGLSKFRIGTYINSDYSGRTCAVYNDWDRIRVLNVGGHTITVGSNIAINNIGYTLGMSKEWLMMCLDGKIKANEIVSWNGAYKNYR